MTEQNKTLLNCLKKLINNKDKQNQSNKENESYDWGDDYYESFLERIDRFYIDLKSKLMGKLRI